MTARTFEVIRQKKDNVVQFTFWNISYVLIVSYRGSLANAFNADLINFGVELANQKPNSNYEKMLKWASEWFTDRNYEVVTMK